MEKIQTEYGIFTNNEETGQTAQQVYDEWLANRDKPPQLTLEETLIEQQKIIDDLIQVLVDKGVVF